jgi:polyisoprenyl-phosphate glycosyltransferase
VSGNDEARRRRVDIVVPIHNEAENVEKLVQRIHAATGGLKDWDVHVLFVDDGSVDDSIARLNEIRKNGLPVGYMSFVTNFGHQAALLAGLEQAKGDAVISMDGDLQHPPEDIPRILEAFTAGADVVQMVREQRAAGGKGLFSRAFYKVFSAAARTEIIADASDFRLVSRRVLDVILGIPERAKFLRALIPSLGFPTTVLIYKEAPRAGGKPSFSTGKSLRLAGKVLFDFSTVPLKFVFWFGTCLAVISFCFGLGHVIYKIIAWQNVVPGFTDLIASILFLSGCILALLGIVSRYLVLILDQLRGRPAFVVKERAEGAALPRESSGQRIP